MSLHEGARLAAREGDSRALARACSGSLPEMDLWGAVRRRSTKQLLLEQILFTAPAAEVCHTGC